MFPKGRYDFYPDQAFERYQHISNNGEGLRRIAFLIDGMQRFEIDGQGSDFLFHGFVSPFAVCNSSAIVLRGFSVDYARTFHSEGKILAVTDRLALGDVLAACDDYAALTIRGNRARGVLLNSRGPTVVEKNTFHTAGAAILFEGDARHWYEQAGVSDCVIHNNLFDNCNYGVWGRALIEVGAGIDPAFRAESRYNRNIRITGNTIRHFHPALLSLYSVQGVTFSGNKLEKTDAYPQWKPDAPRFDTPHCDKVVITE